MIEQTNREITFWAFYTYNGVGVTGLTVTADIWRGATQVANDVTYTELARGLYYYTLPVTSVNAKNSYIALTSATGGDVDAQEMVAAWWVGVGGVDNLRAGEIEIASTINDAGDMLVTRGDDYLVAIGRQFAWTLTNLPTGTISGVLLTCNQLSLSKSCTYAAPVVTAELTATETAAFAKGEYAFDLRATIGTYKTTLLRGTIVVSEDV